MKKRYFFLLLLLSASGFSQVGIGTANVNDAAILELKSISGNQGLLMNEVSLVSLTSAAPFPSHIEGMMVYNKATSSTDPENIFPGLYFNDGTSWKRMAVEDKSPIVGDVKQSVQTADHDGWYLLDGRDFTGLSANAQANALGIGLSENLPDARDMLLKGRSAESFGDTGGSTSFTLSQANLPDVDYTGTTASAGAHTHTYVNRGNTYWNWTTGGVGGMRTTGGSSRTTTSAGAHTHTITAASGGSNTAINFRPKYMVMQTFIYLGT